MQQIWFWISLLLASVVACGGETEPGGGEECVAGVPGCTGPDGRGVGEECSDSDSCGTGLSCYGLNFDPGNEDPAPSVCHESCVPDTGLGCVSGEYCHAVDETGATGICVALAAHGGQCVAEDRHQACSELGEECIPVLTGDVGVCTTRCDPAERYQPSSCRSGELCLDTIAVREQMVTCSVSSDCDEAAGYVCLHFVPPVCGKLFPWDFDSYQAVPCVTDSDCDTAEGFSCGSSERGSICIKSNTACGQFVLAGGGSLLPNGEPRSEYACGTGLEMCGLDSPTGPPARVFCVVNGDLGEPGLCVALCRRLDGTFLDCGVGLTCAVPSGQSVKYPEIGRDITGATLRCVTDADCTDPAYPFCVDDLGPDESFCIGPAAVCVPDGG